jgi:hypothetical protein
MLMDWFALMLACAGGYIAAVWTWDRVHTLLAGIEARAECLRAQAAALEARLRAPER